MQAGKTNGTTNHPQNTKSDYPRKSMNLINIVDNFFNFMWVGVADLYHGIQNTGPKGFCIPFMKMPTTGPDMQRSILSYALLFFLIFFY